MKKLTLSLFALAFISFGSNATLPKEPLPNPTHHDPIKYPDCEVWQLTDYEKVKEKTFSNYTVYDYGDYFEVRYGRDLSVRFKTEKVAQTYSVGPTTISEFPDNGFLERNGFKHTNEGDPNVMFFIDRRDYFSLYVCDGNSRVQLRMQGVGAK